MFKTIKHISDLQAAVAEKKEIRFVTHHSGVTIGCYVFSDSSTFDSPESLECRGIAFDKDGHVVSRPFHKFFNIGEKECISAARVLERDDVVGIYEKLDGSMIATAWVDGKLAWRSKKAFNSDVVVLAREFLCQPGKEGLAEFSSEVARQGLTAIFELTHPHARIVVEQSEPQMRLLAVRENISGKYVLLDSQHFIHDLIDKYKIPKAPKVEGTDLQSLLNSLDSMTDREGFVIQFADGDMVKVKCPWYLRIHRSITFLRERDIALLALNEELDDVKAALAEAGINLKEVNEVESRLKAKLSEIFDQVETIYLDGKDLDRKSFAIKNKEHPLFGLAMNRYLDREIQIADWYSRHRLKEEFGLRILAGDAIAEAIDG